MRGLIIIGANGHGKVVADIARQYYNQIDFLDDNPKLNTLGNISDYIKYLDRDFFVAIGNNEMREKITKNLIGANIISLVHKNAVVANNVVIGGGTVVMAGAVINPDTIIGKGCIINTCASVDHDCIVGDFSHISVGAHLAGTVRVGKKCFICIGATIINNKTICDEVTIGAGATVINDLYKKGIYIGTPAKVGGGIL